MIECHILEPDASLITLGYKENTLAQFSTKQNLLLYMFVTLEYQFFLKPNIQPIHIFDI